MKGFNLQLQKLQWSHTLSQETFNYM